MILRFVILTFLFAILTIKLFAYKVIEDVATKADGYDIPIKICIPDNAEGKRPVMFFVHGGGWNGGDENTVPPATLPVDCNFLCDQMGIIYVGLAYRCKGNNGTFHQALQDLNASVKWFEERAEKFNADMLRIGFSGGSAGTTLSAVLAQQYNNCKVYVGREGMYNVLDLDSSLSNFPNAKSREDFGLETKEQKLEASPFHQVRNNPATSLLLHGKDDWLCHYTQSEKYAEQLRRAGGECTLVLYDNINHHCLNFGYPDVFKNSMIEIAKTFEKGYGLKNVDYFAIKSDLEEKTKLQYPYENIDISRLHGKWSSPQNHVYIFEENGKGKYIHPKTKNSKDLIYENRGSWFSVRVKGDDTERKFYLRKNNHTIFELITENNRWKSRRNDFRKQ